jgi:hypothetical protein
MKKRELRCKWYLVGVWPPAVEYYPTSSLCPAARNTFPPLQILPSNGILSPGPPLSSVFSSPFPSLFVFLVLLLSLSAFYSPFLFSLYLVWFLTFSHYCCFYSAFSLSLLSPFSNFLCFYVFSYPLLSSLNFTLSIERAVSISRFHSLFLFLFFTLSVLPFSNFLFLTGFLTLSSYMFSHFLCFWSTFRLSPLLISLLPLYF